MKNHVDLKIEREHPDSLHKNPTGDPSIGYPQICIRTNRNAQRTDLKIVTEKTNEIADQYPENKVERAKHVIAALNSIFGGGSFGHAWIIIFNSEKEGDYSSYAYHQGYGYVHNGDTEGHTNDSNKRGFSYQHIVSLDRKKITALENNIIPGINVISTAIAYAMGYSPAEGRQGVYSAVTNCSWFAGHVWNLVTSENIEFAQPFPGIDYAERWGIDACYLLSRIADPGVIAESLSITDIGYDRPVNRETGPA
ncbi:hypothetical protein [Erwinia amylovora]|uniref:hypothetical protein n=1 Tax=Erwinia amylovora TaxID=552 RepID=UPI000C076B2F|nr:hypothetical protein [Erwinia amylovora]